eukprot:72450-Prymnesium_polylepis.1
MVGASVHSIGAVRRRRPPLRRQRWRRLTLASLSRYARGDINRSRKGRRLASRLGGHDAGMQCSRHKSSHTCTSERGLTVLAQYHQRKALSRAVQPR